MTDYRVRLGQRLRAARRKAGLSQAEASALIGLSRASIANAEAGRQGVLVDDLAKFALAYRANSDWLLLGHRRRKGVS